MVRLIGVRTQAGYSVYYELGGYSSAYACSTLIWVQETCHILVYPSSYTGKSGPGVISCKNTEL